MVGQAMKFFVVLCQKFGASFLHLLGKPGLALSGALVGVNVVVGEGLPQRLDVGEQLIKRRVIVLAKQGFHQASIPSPASWRLAL